MFIRVPDACPTCNGKRYRPRAVGERQMPCTTCGGTGIDPAVTADNPHPQPPKPRPEPTPCTVCQGRRRQPRAFPGQRTKRCQHCKGTGVEPRNSQAPTAPPDAEGQPPAST